MSDKCGNCDCADKSQCAKGNSYGVVIVDSESHFERREEVTAENDGCNCGSNCACGSNCNCGK